MASDLAHSHDVTSRLSLKEVSSDHATAQMNSNGAYAAIVIPSELHRILTVCLRVGIPVHRPADGAAGDQPTGGRHRGAAGHRSRPVGPPSGVARNRKRSVSGGCRSSAVPRKVESVPPIPLR